MEILAFPRDTSGPYQRLLYGEMRRLGTQVTYLGRLTPSQTVNLILLPLELFARRAKGARLVHLHWVFAFYVPGSERSPVLRWLLQAWFMVWLRSIRMSRMRLVWTAHNVLPHGPVFGDDVAARRALVDASDLVIAHSPAALRELRALGAVPRKSVVIPHGPIGPVTSTGALRMPGTGGGSRRLLFFGKVREYKGVEELLAAMTSVPGDLAMQLMVAGDCDDPALRQRLTMLAGDVGARVVLRLEQIPGTEVTPLLAAADAVVIPYRRITTSGSAMLALAHGRPLVVPELESLADLPEHAVVRYDGTIPGLAAALTKVTSISPAELADMSAAARAYAEGITWREIAATTQTEMTSLVTGTPRLDAADHHLTRSLAATLRCPPYREGSKGDWRECSAFFDGAACNRGARPAHVLRQCGMVSPQLCAARSAAYR
jgi:glycosyltransferase involved in cell wall biosynthesis